MKWDGGERGGNIEDRRGLSPARAGGGIGIGAVAVALIGYFVFGIDPMTMLSMMEQGGGGTSSYTQEAGKAGSPEDVEGKFVDVVLTNTSAVWTQIFDKEGKTYRPPQPLVLYSQATGTGCGFGQSAMGPFYCPSDERIYIDLDFFKELSSRFDAPGDFAKAYVIAHEVGHHVQKVVGTADQVRAIQQRAKNRAEANRYSVAMELQADCYAGVWAANAESASGGRIVLERGDIESGLQAANAIGDDTLQKKSQGHVVPDSFTHGTSEQRMLWLRKGYERGRPDICDTFEEVNAERG